MQDVIFTGKAPEYCVCNWINQDNTCQVPQDWSVQLTEPLKTKWEALVARGSYSTRDDLFLFLQVLQETTAFEPAWFEKHQVGAIASYRAPAVRAKSASGRGLRAHARSAGQVRGNQDKGHLFGAESGPRRPVSWVRSAGRIRPEEQGPPRGGSGAARALPGAPRAAASTLRLSLFHRVLPSSSPASREFTI